MNTCPTCYLDKQKADWKAEKLSAAREAAKLQAKENGQTQAIIKEGCNYRIIASGSLTAGDSPIEFISKHQ